AGDELVPVADLPNEQWLEQAVLHDALGEGGQLLIVEPLAGLVRVLIDAVDRHLGRGEGWSGRLRQHGVAEQGVEALAEARRGTGGHRSGPCPGVTRPNRGAS